MAGKETRIKKKTGSVVRSKRSTLSTKRKKKASSGDNGMPTWKRNLLMVGAVAAFCVAFYFLFIKPYAYRWKSCPQGKTYGVCIPCDYQMHGMDVSHYQGSIDWQEIRSSNLEEETPLGFVFAKATEGSTIKDETYRDNQQGARSAGITFGAYHFLTTTSSAQQQARFFIDNSDLQSGDLPPVLDVESAGKLSVGELQTMVHEWLDMVESHYKVKPIIYASYKFREKYLSDPSFDAYPYWIAHHYVDAVRYMGHWEFWQHNDTGKVPGIEELVDLNVYNGSEVDFRSLLIP